MRILRWIAAVLAAAALGLAGPLAAQDADRAIGAWSGSLAVTPSSSLTLVVTIERDGDGSLTGTLDSPDQNSFGLPLEAVRAQESRLSFRLPAIGASFAGEWDSAASGWRGSFTQAGRALPLLLTRLDPAARPLPVALPADWQLPSEDELVALLARRVADRPGAGFVLAASDKDGRTFLSVDPLGGGAFDEHTVFEIGSITKVFTALLLADMVLAGEVALGDPVEKYLPAGARMPRREGRQITLADLSLQTSGLPRLPGNMPYGDPANPYADYTEAMLLDFLAHYELPRDIGAHYEYSNLGVGLLGYALARAAGTDYESLLRERILDPLGLDETAITLSTPLAARFATPHDEYLRETKPWDLPLLAGAGALRSTARDLLTFGRAAIDPASPIAGAMALTLSQRTAHEGTDNETALGWMIMPAPGGEVLNHGGGTGGFRSHLAVQPASGRVVVALTNAAVEPSASDLAMHVLTGSPLIAEEPVPPAPAPAPERAAIVLTGAQLAPLVGVYRMANNARLTVTREGDQLFAQLTSQPAFPIYPAAPRRFFWKVVDAQIAFTPQDGAITGATLYQNGAEMPLTRMP